MDLLDLFVKITVDDGEVDEKFGKTARKSDGLSASFKGLSGASEILQNKVKILSSQYSKAEKEVARLTEALNKSARENGATADETLELSEKLKQAEKASASLKKEMDRLSKEMDEAGGNASGLSGKLETLKTRIGSGLATASRVGGAAIGAIAAGITALGKIAFDYNSEIETYMTNFSVMMGDAAAAAAKVEELKEMGAKTPFELGDLANATQTLLAFNVTADESTGVLQRLGDISLGNVQKLESLTRAYGKMNASQKVTLEDINMMIDAGFNPLLLVAENTGETMEQVYGRISKGAVSFEEIQGAIEQATSAGGQFYQGMDQASKTTAGLISTLKDNVTALIGEVFTPVTDGITKSVLPGAISAIGTLTDAFREQGVGGMIDAAGNILGSVVSSLVSGAPKLVGVAVSLINSLINGLSQNVALLSTGAVSIITTLASGLISMLPQIVALGLDLIVSLATGIAAALPELIPTIVDVVVQIGMMLISPDNIAVLAGSAIPLMIGLASGLIAAVSELVKAAPRIIGELKDSLIGNSPTIKAAGTDVIEQLVNGLVDNFMSLVDAGVDIIYKVEEGLQNARDVVIAAGQTIIDNVLQGMKNAWNNVVTWFKDAVGNLRGNAHVGITTQTDSAYTGLEYVPYDNYPVITHKGEAILTKSEAEAWRNGESGGKGNGGITIVQNISAVPQTPVETAAATAAYFEQARWAFT